MREGEEIYKQIRGEDLSSPKGGNICPGVRKSFSKQEGGGEYNLLKDYRDFHNWGGGTILQQREI